MMTAPAPGMHEFDYVARVERLRREMENAGIDALVLSAGPDLLYFTGYDASPSERLTAFVVSDADAELFVPELEAPLLAGSEFGIHPWGETESPVELASPLLGRTDRIAVGNHMWSVFLMGFIRAVPGAEWLPASEVTSHLRLRKDRTEIGLLRAAAGAVDRVMERIPSEVSFAGRSEIDVARDLAEMTIEEGHDESAFAIVASGENGASPHHQPTARQIAEGDLVVCDFGGRWGGYNSDSTRTFSVGEPSPRHAEVHEVVMRANERSRAAVSPGMPCEELDAVTREVIDAAGFGKQFIHRTGHGIGLEVHEQPYIVRGNEMQLEPGMAFSIEPGIYLPGQLGIRIEDIVVCTDHGAEELNRSLRGLTIVG